MWFPVSLLMAGVAIAGTAGAEPRGGQVVGGSGSINRSGANTTINQASQRMAIAWQSYNVDVDERVQHIQPNQESLSLIRILSHQGSTMAAGKEAVLTFDQGGWRAGGSEKRPGFKGDFTICNKMAFVNTHTNDRNCAL